MHAILCEFHMIWLAHRLCASSIHLFFQIQIITMVIKCRKIFNWCLDVVCLFKHLNLIGSSLTKNECWFYFDTHTCIVKSHFLFKIREKKKTIFSPVICFDCLTHYRLAANMWTQKCRIQLWKWWSLSNLTISFFFLITCSVFNS